VRLPQLRYVVLSAVPLIVVGLGLVVWFVPNGPKIVRGGLGSGLSGAYEGDYYTAWNVIGPTKTIVIKDIQVDVTGSGCHGTFRLIHKRTVDAPYINAITTSLPGTAVTGQRISPATGTRLAVVLTSTGIGPCVAQQVRIGSDVWGRERWTTTPLDFSIDVTHSTGMDSRVSDGPTLPL
jgi:hypothetical protein